MLIPMKRGEITTEAQPENREGLGTSKESTKRGIRSGHEQASPVLEQYLETQLDGWSSELVFSRINERFQPG